MLVSVLIPCIGRTANRICKDLACERGRCYLSRLLNAFEGATSIRSGSSSDEEVMKEAMSMWGRGPTGPGIKDTMFYI
jgi:eukaryotic translation initiation factor 2C